MTITLAFDVYGTLIDTQGVIAVLEKHIGDKAIVFSQTWRDKQLEYSFRRACMGSYKDFSVCTRDAFEYTCLLLGVEIDKQAQESCLKAYQTLPAFEDVKEGLLKVQNAGFQRYAFSNGTANAVESVLTNAGIRDYFSGIVSVDEVQSFKPDPAVYHHFLQRTKCIGTEAWLVSSNPFDVIGAISAGMQAAWVQRSEKTIFDPWGITPTLTLTSLSDLAAIISAG